MEVFLKLLARTTPHVLGAMGCVACFTVGMTVVYYRFTDDTGICSGIWEHAEFCTDTAAGFCLLDLLCRGGDVPLACCLGWLVKRKFVGELTALVLPPSAWELFVQSWQSMLHSSRHDGRERWDSCSGQAPGWVCTGGIGYRTQLEGGGWDDGDARVRRRADGVIVRLI